MDPVIITFTNDELMRMFEQVGEHNTVDGPDATVINLCICRECDTVRAFKATTPIKVEINNRKATAQLAEVLGDFLSDLFNGKAQAEPTEGENPAEDTPADEEPTGEIPTVASAPATLDGCECDYCEGVRADAAPGGRD